MQTSRFLLIAALLFSAVSFAQDDLYLSPASQKTASNSMIITPEGKVGIGKANPSDELEVNGRVHAKSVKVDLEGWADFVFKPEYNLPSLQQIEAYIKQNGHLEGIPSEEEALTSGIDLGQMNTLLLQKVEELTLHIIEKDKEIKALEARLDRLEKLIQEQD